NPDSVLDQVLCFVGEIHLDQHIAGKNTTFGDGFFSTLYFDALFGGNQYAAEGRLEPGTLDAFEQRLVHTLLHAGIDVDDIPTFAHVWPLSPRSEERR